MSQFMQVREVARILGVHENTVRRWEERGLLRAVRLPSGVRRFRPEDVEAVRAEMFSGFAPVREDDDVVPVTRVRPDRLAPSGDTPMVPPASVVALDTREVAGPKPAAPIV